MPRVDVVHAYGSLDADAVKAIGARGKELIFADTGSGIVLRSGAQSDDAYGWLTFGDQIPSKARILLTLALTQTDDVATCRRHSKATEKQDNVDGSASPHA